jgi:hypothetical protein
MTNLSNIARLELLKAAVDCAHAEQVAATGKLALGITNRKLHDAFNEYAAFHAVCFDEKGRPRDQFVEAVSFKPELHINGEGWVANDLRFASAAEAIACARDLLGRWTLAQNARATSSLDVPTHVWSDGQAKQI